MNPQSADVPPSHPSTRNGSDNGGAAPHATVPAPPPEARRSRFDAAWKHRWPILAVALLAGLMTLAVATRLPSRYVSTAHVRVAVTGQNGVDDQTVLAANDLARQYAALTNTPAVRRRAADRLGVPATTVAGIVSTGTVQDQNIMALEAQGATAEEARARAEAVAEAVVGFVNATARRTAVRQRAAIAKGLTPISRASEAEAAERRHTTDAVAVTLALGAPQLHVLGAGAGSKTFPRPALFGAVAVLVVLLAAAQVAVLVEGRRK